MGLAGNKTRQLVGAGRRAIHSPVQVCVYKMLEKCTCARQLGLNATPPRSASSKGWEAARRADVRCMRSMTRGILD